MRECSGMVVGSGAARASRWGEAKFVCAATAASDAKPAAGAATATGEEGRTAKAMSAARRAGVSGARARAGAEASGARAKIALLPQLMIGVEHKTCPSTLFILVTSSLHLFISLNTITVCWGKRTDAGQPPHFLDNPPRPVDRHRVISPVGTRGEVGAVDRQQRWVGGGLERAFKQCESADRLTTRLSRQIPGGMFEVESTFEMAIPNGRGSS
jgi:hypothetical protein